MPRVPTVLKNATSKLLKMEVGESIMARCVLRDIMVARVGILIVRIVAGGICAPRLKLSIALNRNEQICGFLLDSYKRNSYSVV